MNLAKRNAKNQKNGIKIDLLVFYGTSTQDTSICARGITGSGV